MTYCTTEFMCPCFNFTQGEYTWSLYIVYIVYTWIFLGSHRVRLPNDQTHSQWKNSVFSPILMRKFPIPKIKKIKNISAFIFKCL